MAVTVSHLANGLTVVTEEMPHIESAALGVWVGAGSRSEDEREHGISHLLEHMAFKGTRRRSAQAIAEEIEAVGGELNAATSVENTCYYARLLGDDVPLAIDILSDILNESLFDRSELKREQNVILQEIGAAYDTPEDHVFDLFQEAAWPSQPLGRPIMGTPESVKSFTSRDIADYLGTHYRGPASVLAAAGGVRHDEIVRLAEERFSGFSKESAPVATGARYRGGDRREVRDTMEAQFALGFEGRAYGSPDYFAAQMLAAVLGGGMASRLFQEIRERRGLCYSIYGFHWGFSDTGLIGFHAATGGSELGELAGVLVEELARSIDDIGEAELARAKAQMRASLLMAQESAASRASQLARQILIHRRPLPVREIVAKIDAVDVRDLRRLAGEIFTGSAPTLSAIGPVEGLDPVEALVERLGARQHAHHVPA
ncbi:Predicted Zn-dependent peptidase [Pseudoxanthobacter soli DSM 19599]|uniref:Predicted Zn-dependent peptidase n=1 Tax=Pseudoxanthobacter soli DSM 19599 TaxID=1123029 RepID=A0A1M7Z5D7_9HYPH|nr:pitrilysin family protein [Pseudoxanthobacter soli]SHO60032.1 Predicted Zn-dependent peptidase [Pseudoxanthobacter soli DSM 19599]